MYGKVLLSSFLFSFHASCMSQFLSYPGRRVCVGSAAKVIYSTQSFIQPVPKPYITMCLNQLLCTTYKTVYKVSYRQVSRVEPSSNIYSDCCPGWRRRHSLSCNHAVCVQPCLNGGSCLRPNHCVCPIGWTGRYCQIDVDECKGGHGCNQQCVNSAGSYQCVCVDGFQLAEDGKFCLSLPPPLPPRPTLASPPKEKLPSANTSEGESAGLGVNVTEEVQFLKNRVELLERKLEMVLAPFSTLFPPEEGVADKNSFLIDRTSFPSEQTNFLSHSLRQLDRIDSLSEQVGFLEERLGTCSCQEN